MEGSRVLALRLLVEEEVPHLPLVHLIGTSPEPIERPLRGFPVQRSIWPSLATLNAKLADQGAS
jgi:hypothetical protein